MIENISKCALVTIVMTCVFPMQVWAKSFHVFHTNDWQSRLVGYGPNSEYQPQRLGDGTKGGVARLATLLKSLRQKHRDDPHLTLDAGDFSMGTLFHTLTRETGSELQLLKMLDFDAVCIGNHEFDFRPSGLSRMIRSALKQLGSLPPLLASNIIFSRDDPEDRDLKALMDEGVIKRELIIERVVSRFGILGVLGKQAVEVATEITPVSFEDPVVATKRMAKALKREKGVDVVIVLSHGDCSRSGFRYLEWRRY